MEDDLGLARLLQKRLERDGYRVDLAADGEKGLALLAGNMYDVMIVDYNMPVLGGLDVIRTLSSQKRLVPTIMVTGVGNESVAVEALKLGASDYLVKDVEQGYLELLPIVLQQVLHEQRLVSEHKKMEVELIKAQKLESIGVLAGGIAHDFNNLLTSIMGNISLAKMLVTPEDRIFSILDKAEKISQRASVLTNHLITFSSGGLPRKKALVLSDLIKDTVHLSLSGSRIRSEFSLDRDLWMVNADEGQLYQAVNAIVLNAQEAMPDGGTIAVTARNVELPPQQAAPLTPGNYVRISIQDCGVGIPEENLSKVFDPYFSNKEMGSQKGMGLGLAICYSIVKNHEGMITIESQVGAGTVLHIYLPAFPRPVTEEGPPVLVHGSGRILIMDDDRTVLDVAREMLEQLGYAVVAAQDGEAAIARFQEALHAGSPFDAVILDLTVSGGMGGVDALKRIRELDPKVKALVSNGYSQDPVMRDFEDNGFRGAIVKPYKLRELAVTLANVVMDGGVGK